MKRQLFITAIMAVAASAAHASGDRSPVWQNEYFAPVLPVHHEAVEDAYERGSRLTTPPPPPTFLRRNGFQSVQVNVDVLGDNIVGDAANEPSIAVDPTNPLRMAIGWRQFDTVISNFRQAGWAYTEDGGLTWTFPGSLAAGTFGSDPVLATNSAGRFFYYTLKSGFVGNVFHSDDAGQSWSDAVFAFGGDKPWMTVDRTGGLGAGHVYAFSRRDVTLTIELTRSIDDGQTFESPVVVPLNPGRGTLAVGSEGELYLAGYSFVGAGFVVTRSDDARDPATTPTFTNPAWVDLGGWLVSGTGPNPGGLLGQVWVDADRSNSPARGTVYVLCSVDPPGSDPMDVMLARSTDGGQTWSAPVRVNDDPAGPGAWQWFGTLSVAPNGRIDVVWVDTRNSNDERIGELFYAFSTDNGQSFSENVAITPAFDSHLGWPQQNKLGDYYHMVSDNAGADLAYAATFNGEQDVYYLRLGQRDCNENGVPDDQDIANGTSADCNNNLLPDECEQDCNNTGVPDDCDVDPTDPDGDGHVSPDCNANDVPDECEPGGLSDCNDNGLPDLCDIFNGTSVDCQPNAVPDECEPDCNANGVQDDCDIAANTSFDCDGNGIPDECDIAAGSDDCQPNDVLDACEPVSAADDCAAARFICAGRDYYGTTVGAGPDGSSSCGDSDTTPDVWYRYRAVGGGLLTVSLCQSHYDTVLSIHTSCPGTAANEVACSDDSCNAGQSRASLVVTTGQDYWIRVSGADGATGDFLLTASGPACDVNGDCNDNSLADECEPDCNRNGVPDACDIAAGTSTDLNANGYPDECEVPGDTNCDGLVNAGDIDGFVLALTDEAGYLATFPQCPLMNADANGDELVNAGDIDAFVALLVASP